MNNLQKLYKILLKEYGPQGWWPVVNSKGKAQYHLNTPRNRQDSFEIAVNLVSRYSVPTKIKNNNTLVVITSIPHCIRIIVFI